MKHADLRSIAHNVAASLGGGCSFLIGVYDLDISAATKEAPGGEITVDFLRGTVSGVPLSSPVAKAAELVPAALPALCEKHGISISAFSEMKARYWSTPQGIRFVVNVVDQSGHATETEYGGYDGQRTKVLDATGQLRPKPIDRM
jgi:hypothetical protein